jgi:pimeloyl-ACP methyl ester carboxylesterase
MANKLLNYRLEGSGSPLLLLHGWGDTFDIWNELAPLLSPHFQLVMVELPGFGQSPLPGDGQPYFQACVAPLEQLRVLLGFQDWAVLSYSLGTRIGEAYLQQHPSSISRSIFLCPLYLPAGVGGRLRAFMMCSLLGVDRLWPHFGDWLISGRRLRFLIRILAFNGRQHPFISDWHREITSQSPQVLKMSLREASRVSSAPFNLPPGPTIHYIWGKNDRIVPIPSRPRSTDSFIRADHSAPAMAAPQVAEIVVHFLSGAIPASSTPAPTQ